MVERFAFRRALSVTVNIENLVQAESGEKLLASVPAVHDMKMPESKFLQPQCDAGHGSHERGIHHGAMFQIHHELAIASVKHLAGELLGQVLLSDVLAEDGRPRLDAEGLEIGRVAAEDFPEVVRGVGHAADVPVTEVVEPSGASAAILTPGAARNVSAP